MRIALRPNKRDSNSIRNYRHDYIVGEPIAPDHRDFLVIRLAIQPPN